MATLVEPAQHTDRLEALPRWPSTRPTRFSVGEQPPHEPRGPRAPGESSAPGKSSLPFVLRGVRVLVVDDDEDAVALFEAALTACGADVVTANSAPAALRVLDARSVDVVVSDIAMPGADGYWLLREIRRLTKPAAKTLPVVAVTAFGREHGRVRTFEAGFVDHLVKPLDPEALCRAVAKAASR
jgi:CheY-like chemotaxis protein